MSVEFADALMTATGDGNLNRLDTFVAAQPLPFGDIRKKCAEECACVWWVLYRRTYRKLTANRPVRLGSHYTRHLFAGIAINRSGRTVLYHFSSICKM